jgi:class 3 adenylate cyclase
MQQIADWLEKLGMSEYAERFAEHDIDIEVLSELTDKDFDRLGVSIGHRRKMMRTIREFAASPISATDTHAVPRDAAERRQVTVMFSDLVGSTALSARMDPEDLREVISAYQKCVAATVQRFGGFVAKYMGDGVLVYLGYPQAHEDDAERAVRAGLELVAAVGGLKTHAPLQTRVGIATGLVVVGDLIGSGASQEQAIVGETPNLAARLQGVAEPNCVVIAESTRKLVGNLFELENLGPQELKGISDPVTAWVAMRPASVEGRFEAFHATGLTELVGREEELELLLRRWSKAKTGEGEVVLVSSEPGIGKSRLTAALLERLAAEPHTRLRYFCSPHHQDSALYPTIVQLERAAGFERDDTPEIKFHKLEALLAATSLPIADMTLLAELLHIPASDLYTPRELNPQRRKEETFEALLRQLAALARHQPLLMIYEDVHWIDPSSRELLDRVVDRVAGLPVLLLITFRPKFQQPWAGQSHVTLLALSRLAHHQGAMLVRWVAGDRALPADTLKEIVDRTDGVPLFVEELTKAVLEDHGDSHGAGDASISALALPATLQASLMARLDRLGPGAKRVAQTGAAVGREFSYELLSAIAGGAERKLQHELARLVTSELVF